MSTRQWHHHGLSPLSEQGIWVPVSGPLLSLFTVLFLAKQNLLLKVQEKLGVGFFSSIIFCSTDHELHVMLSSLVGKMALVNKIQPVLVPSMFMVLANSSYLMHLGFDHRQTLQPWGGVEWTWSVTQALQMWRYCWGQLKKC